MSSTLTRRAALAGALGTVLPRQAKGTGPAGTTLRLALKSAPFASYKYKDPTVLVYVPEHYRPVQGDDLDVVVHFHGMHYTAERAVRGHVLREQFDDSEQEAILIVPQLAVMAPDSDAGSLEKEHGLARLLAEVFDSIRASHAPLAGARGIRNVCLSAHSGGYNAAIRCLELGGVDIRECWLFDALYGSLDVLETWVSGFARSRLISFHAGGETTKNSLSLASALSAKGVDCRQEKPPPRLSRSDLLDGQAVFIPIPNEHAGAVFAQNNFRDCLRASVFRQRGPGVWFHDMQAPRKVDRRGGG